MLTFNDCIDELNSYYRDNVPQYKVLSENFEKILQFLSEFVNKHPLNNIDKLMDINSNELFLLILCTVPHIKESFDDLKEIAYAVRFDFTDDEYKEFLELTDKFMNKELLKAAFNIPYLSTCPKETLEEYSILLSKFKDDGLYDDLLRLQSLLKNTCPNDKSKEIFSKFYFKYPVSFDNCYRQALFHRFVICSYDDPFNYSIKSKSYVSSLLHKTCKFDELYSEINAIIDSLNGIKKFPEEDKKRREKKRASLVKK